LVTKQGLYCFGVARNVLIFPSHVPKLVAWNNLLPRMTNIELTNEQDEFHWNLNPYGKFSMKSRYQGITY
jgi:hypothetical protein